MTPEQIVKTNYMNRVLPISYDYDDDEIWSESRKRFSQKMMYNLPHALVVRIGLQHQQHQGKMQIKKDSLVPKGTKKRDSWAMNLHATWKNYHVGLVLQEETDMKEALCKPLLELNVDEMNF